MDLQTIKEQIIRPIAVLAHMDINEARDLLFVYLDIQRKQVHKTDMDDSNIESIFSNIAEKKGVSLEVIKKEVYEALSSIK